MLPAQFTLRVAAQSRGHPILAHAHSFSVADEKRAGPAPVRFGSLTVRAWDASSGSGVQFRWFLSGKVLFCLNAVLAGLSLGFPPTPEAVGVSDSEMNVMT